LFSNRDLKRLIIPLVIEQTLALTVGMFDAMMVSSAGEAAMSGVSLVDTIAILLINMFSAFAAGGAILVGQRVGARDLKSAGEAARLLVGVSFVLSAVITALCLALNRGILTLFFGTIEADVMSSARSYFYITTLSFPFVAVFNAAAALFRSMGDSRTPMIFSVMMNAINIVGNAIFIYGAGLGAFGAGLSTTIARVAAAVLLLIALRSPKLPVSVRSYGFGGTERAMMRHILRFGLPNGLENSIFQIGKILLAGLVSTLGTTSIAANSVVNNLGVIAIIPGAAIGAGMTTVVAQCVGAGETGQARRYVRRLMIITLTGMALFAAMIYILTPFLLKAYNLSDETEQLARRVMLMHNIAVAVLWGTAFVPPNALRASGDVVYPMIVAIASMFVCRVGLGYLLVYTTSLGIVGVYLGMFTDWVLRAALYMRRYFKLSRKWALAEATKTAAAALVSPEENPAVRP
jgi:putative MATE family efflux protein